MTLLTVRGTFPYDHRNTLVPYNGNRVNAFGQLRPPHPRLPQIADALHGGIVAGGDHGLEDLVGFLRG